MSDVTDNANFLLANASQAAAVFTQYDQGQVDRIIKAVYEAGFNNRIELARKAYQETEMGVWEHKVLKNIIASQLVYEDIKNLKTVGIISEDEQSGITEIAQPLGPILAIVPVTNPTSTVLFKILIALKTRNPIIISPHSRAAECCRMAAEVCYEAALKEDAPENCIQLISNPSRDLTQELMHHEQLALILATGGMGLVKTAYSSGTPAIGVGAGNVPVFIEKSADIPFAVEQIILSKTFDNGTICASEQAVVMQKKIGEQVKTEFETRGAYFLSIEEQLLVEQVAFDSDRQMMSGDVVGKSAEYIAEKAGVKVPAGTILLMAELDRVGDDCPLSSEILAPILAFYQVADFDAAINLCIDLNYHGGIGHTVSIFSNNEKKIKDFATIMNAGRIVVNMPSAHGAVGGTCNTLSPSLTLGCGTGGKNITTDNITAHHLLNIQRITRRRDNFKWFRFDQKQYFDESLSAAVIEKKYHQNT